MRNIKLILGLLILWIVANAQGTREVSVIPFPAKVISEVGTFTFTEKVRIVTLEPSWADLLTYAARRMEFALNYPLATEVIEYSMIQNNCVVISSERPYNPELGTEGYLLEIQPEVIRIRANTKQGGIYGVETLSQLVQSENGRVGACVITDYPRFAYRGLHLDVSRHFMPISFIYRILDYMAMHKLNVFHWHLVDDQGWRLEIKKYPRLTSIGAWRPNLEHLPWNDRTGKETQAKGLYGGFYTQEEVKSIVEYANKIGITIIPEIEMPAHVMSALAAYPQLSCTGANQGVIPGGVWPISHIYCAGNDSTFIFLEDVLSEVMNLFPGTFIHIGGDEADKTQWKKCEKCQARIRAEGLKDEAELQSYFVRRIEKFLNAHGRILIGWDEILEGGLAPKSVVMSWRGVEGGIEAVHQHHHVIMTPGSHCYFDHYQGDPSVEPLAIGGFTPLKKVYNYEPVPPVLSPSEALYVLGAQANVWTEYMPNPQHVEYMIFPRLAALAEVLWSPTDKRDYKSFSKRLKNQLERYDKLGINYARSIFQVNINPTVDTIAGHLVVELTSDASYGEIHYTLDGIDPGVNSPIYTDKIIINTSATIKTAVFYEGQRMGAIISRTFDLHKAFGRKVSLLHSNASPYDGGGAIGLCNGVYGTTSYSDGQWKGFLEKDAIITLDLGKQLTIKSISVDALQNSGAWIFYPEKVVFEISLDGEVWQKMDEKLNDTPWQWSATAIKIFKSKKLNVKARYVRVTLKNRGICPEGHSGAGQPCWVFTSELSIH